MFMDFYLERQRVRRHRDRAAARVQYALKSGRLRKEPCMVCGELQVQAHHSDYDKPYEVKWLCIKHHAELHKILRQLSAAKSPNPRRSG
jgi:hypothetical protein